MTVGGATAAARVAAPGYTSFRIPLGSVAVRETRRKNAAGIRMGAIGAPSRATHFQTAERPASST